jgi:UDP-glucose 4-epimerase
MKRVFITGGAGFIGSHLVERLLNLGKEVTVYDCLTPASKQKDRLAKFQGVIGFNFVERNILNSDALVHHMVGHDCVIHLAANGDIPAGIDNPYLDLNNNVIGTHNVLESMRQLGISNLLFASSAAVYGYPEQRGKPYTHECSETDAPLFPISLYGGSKLACEALISGYAYMFGIQSLIFRFGNIVGATMDHGVIHDLIAKARKNKYFSVWGDGKGLKPYLLVEDCINGMMSAYNVTCETSNPSCVDIFNLGANGVTSVSEVAEIVASHIPGSAPVYEGGKYGFKGDVPVVRLTSAKMNAIGWRPRCTSTEAVMIATERILQDKQ